MKKILFCFLLVTLLCLSGCIKSISSFTTFEIQGFDEFFDFHTTTNEKELIIRNGEIEFAKVGNLYVCPFIKEINYEECALFFYVYQLEDISVETVTISDIVLSVNEESIVIYESSDNRYVALEKDRDFLLGMVNDIVFEKSENWFFNDNELSLSFKVTNDEECVVDKEFSYDVRIIYNERAKTPT